MTLPIPSLREVDWVYSRCGNSQTGRGPIPILLLKDDGPDSLKDNSRWNEWKALKKRLARKPRGK